MTARRATMARKRYKAEEIVAKLRQVDVLTSQGQSMADAIRQIGVSEVTYYVERIDDVENVAPVDELVVDDTDFRDLP